MKIEIVKPSDADCLIAQVEAGCILMNLDQSRGKTFEQAEKEAISLVRAAGGRWGIFRLCAVVEAGQGSKAHLDPMIEKSQRAMAGVT